MKESKFPELNNERIIEANRNAEKVSVSTAEIIAGNSVVDVRLRGAYVTFAELYSPSLGMMVPILYSDSDTELAKLSATHAMIPYGANEGTASGQHGFPRWSDYSQVSYSSSQGSPSRLLLEADNTEGGLGLVRGFSLEQSALRITNTVHNATKRSTRSSIGEHAYFNLAHGDFKSLQVNGKSLTEALGNDSYDILGNSGTLYHQLPEQGLDVTFPQGYTLNINADFIGESRYPLAVLFWQRPGTESICIEPVIGVSPSEANDGVLFAPGSNASLSTSITLK